MKNINIPHLIITAIVVGSICFFVGKKYAEPEPVEVTSTTVDSLLQVTRSLQDSIQVLAAKEEEVVKVKTLYKMKYDTIRIYTDANTILNNLRSIVAQPINE